MIDKTCEYCGITFRVQKYRKDTARFCSGSCRSNVINSGEKSYLWKGGKIQFTCKQCGKICFRNRGAKNYDFCSNHCYDVSRQKRVKLVCENCGKKFEQAFSKAKRYARVFCSHSCYSIFSVGEKSAQWRGGDKEYPATFNRQFKNAIRKRDNYTCAICKEYGDNVHHINYVKNDTVPENCITLCRSCHAKTNSNRDYWIKYFMQSYF